MIKLVLGTVTAMTLHATQAAALSCMFGDPTDAHSQAVQNGTNFVTVVGTLDWEPFGPYPEHNGFAMEYEGQTYAVEGHFKGDVLGLGGVRTPIETAVIIQAECINGDCGYASRGLEMLSFLHTVDDETVMFTYPCQSYPTAASAEAISELQACIDSGNCAPF